MPNEANRCRKFVVPKLQAAGWDNEPHSIAEQRYFTDGRCADAGELPFTQPDMLQIPTITKHGKLNEIIGKFGGADQLRNAVNQLQSLLYAA